MSSDWRDRFARRVAQQLAEPRGLWGRAIGAMMNAANADINKDAVALLDVLPTHRVLEIGFGGGGTLSTLLRRVPDGSVHGLERSTTMLERARRHNARARREGRLELREGDAASLPWSANSFDRVLTVNTIYFWTSPIAALTEVRRVLQPLGVFVLAFRPKALMERLPVSAHGFTLYDHDEVLDFMHAARLEVTHVTFGGRSGHEHSCVVAQPLLSTP